MALGAPWTAQEAEAAIPTNRRGLFEHELRLTAKGCGLDAVNLKHPGESNCWYVLVRADKLWITCHHVDRPNRFVRPALSRKQAAAVNSWLDTTFFEELMQELPPQLGDADRTYAHLLHGLVVEERAGKKFPSLFMRLAFPHVEQERYVRNYDVLELLQLYATRVVPPMSGSGQVADNANPVLNVKTDANENTEKKNEKQVRDGSQKR